MFAQPVFAPRPTLFSIFSLYQSRNRELDLLLLLLLFSSISFYVAPVGYYDGCASHFLARGFSRRPAHATLTEGEREREACNSASQTWFPPSTLSRRRWDDLYVYVVLVVNVNEFVEAI